MLLFLTRCFFCIALALSVVFFGIAEAWASAPERQVVVVGGYQFEPYVEVSGGVAPQFLQLLNDKQDQFEFRFLEIPARRRYSLMQARRIDMILFEMQAWGWEDKADLVAVTPPLLSGAEVFVTRAEEYQQDPKIFERLQSKKLALTLGYHYGFAGFNASPDFLKKTYDVVLSDFQRHTLRHVIAGSADLAVVNEAFLERAFRETPDLRYRLKVSPKPDQEYRLPVMVRKNGPINVADVIALFDQLQKTGELQAFFERQGLGKFLLRK